MKPRLALLTPGRRALLAALAAGTLGAVTGCGFKLKGEENFSFQTLYLNVDERSPVGLEFRRLLRTNSRLKIVRQPEQGAVRVDIVRELREKQIVSFSAAGRPREYQLRLRIVFRVSDQKGAELIPTTEVIQRREITTSDTQLMSKEQEDVIMFREMQADIVQQLILRLAAIRL